MDRAYELNSISHPSDLHQSPHSQSPQSSQSTGTSDEMVDPTVSSQPLSQELQELDQATVRKLDVILLPFLALIFLFNSLDRSNVGNAETANFMADVGLKEEDLNTAVALFFIFFVALQPVGAAVGRRVGMSIWVPTCMTIWGLCTTLHIWIRARWQLYSLRIIIGILEAGFYPVTVSYLSLFYTRFEFGRRLALFYGQYALAGALGGILSYAVFSHFGRNDGDHNSADGNRGWYPWQILFLVEGIATITVALIGYFWLPRSPGTAWFLNREQRRWAEERILRDRSSSADLFEPNKTPATRGTDENEDPSSVTEPSEVHHLLSSTYSARSFQQYTDSRGLAPHDILSALLSPKIYFILFCNILSSIPVTAFAVFLPLVLKPLAPSSALANLLTVPPYLCGAAVLYAFNSWSDKHEERLRPILVSLGVLLLGLLAVVIIPDTTIWAVPRYLALCVLLSGTFVASPLTIAWISGNTPSPGKRALLLGLNGWGNLAGVFSAVIFSPRFAPTYQVSFWVATLCVGTSAAGYALLRALLVKENEERMAAVSSWDDESLQLEMMEGTGPLQDDPRVRRLDTLIQILGFFKLERAKSWVETVSREGREGDEKVTFMYGL